MSADRGRSALRKPLASLVALLMTFLCGARTCNADTPRLYGMLESTLDHAADGRAIGLRVAVVSVSWDRFEPERDKIDGEYVREILRKKRAYQQLGYKLQLDPGVQYPPKWVFFIPNSRYRNQFGDYFKTSDPGASQPNVVFNAEIRGKVADYFHEILERLGADWDYVRLGCGKYGELNYPSDKTAGRTNCYWAFDDLAQGKTPGLPAGISPCPVPGWIPGTPSPDHESARKFAAWYLDALRNYQAWQIATLRRDFSGEICMLYGSWGIRPGWLSAAVEGDLAGLTAPERNGEIQQGFDWTRMIGDIRDSKVIVYCTWLDGTLANRDLADDDSGDPARWSPVHWQADLARAHSPELRVWGENTGSNNLDAMARSFKRMERFGLIGMVWAFERQLFAKSNPEGFAAFDDYRELIRSSP